MNAFYRLRALPLASALLLTLAATAARAQVSPPDDDQSGTASALDQASEYPVQSQMAETPNLDRLNENADTIKYSDGILMHGPLFMSVDASGTGTSNLKDTFNNVPSTAGAYFSLGAPLGLHFWNPVTDFRAYFRYDSDFYPGYSGLNHASEIYTQELTHQVSDTTTTSWSVASGHVVTLGSYLSPVIGIGSTGVVAAQTATGLQSLIDAATTYSITHQMNERNSWIAEGTAGWIEQPVLGPVASSGTTTYREATGGGDARWQHALNSREMAGIELNDVYVRGLSPIGMNNFASAKLTFGQTLTPHSSLTAGIGPLYTHSQVGSAPSQNDMSYTANVGFDYRTAFGHVNGGYARVYEIGFLVPTSAANELYFAFDRPLTQKIFLSADTQYLKTSMQPTMNDFSSFGYTARLDMYLNKNLAYHINGSSFIRPSSALGPGYSGNSISSGITFYFGSALSRAGVE